MNELQIGDLLSRTLALARTNAVTTVGAIATLAGLATACDLLLGNNAVVANIPLTVASLVAQAVVVRVALATLALPAAASSLRIGGLFVLGLLSNLAILLGLVALIVPGLYLLARWFVAAPALFRDDCAPSEAMRRSWDLTAPHAWKLVGLALLIYLPAWLLVIAATLLLENIAPAALVSILTNLLIYGMLIIGWYAAVAVYARLADPFDDLSEVFA